MLLHRFLGYGEPMYVALPAAVLLVLTYTLQITFLTKARE